MATALTVLATVGLLGSAGYALFDKPASEVPRTMQSATVTGTATTAEVAQPARTDKSDTQAAAKPESDAVVAEATAPTPSADLSQTVAASTAEHAAVEPSVGTPSPEPTPTATPTVSEEATPEVPEETVARLDGGDRPGDSEVDAPTPIAKIVEPPERDLDATELALWSADDEPFPVVLAQVSTPVVETAPPAIGDDESVVAASAEATAPFDAVVDGAFAESDGPDAEATAASSEPAIETEAVVSLAADLPPHALPVPDVVESETILVATSPNEPDVIEPEVIEPAAGDGPRVANGNGHELAEAAEQGQAEALLMPAKADPAAVEEARSISVEPVRLSELLPSVIVVDREPTEAPAAVEVIEEPSEAAPRTEEPPSILAEPPPYDPIPAEPLASEQPAQIASLSTAPATTPLPTRRPTIRQLSALPPSAASPVAASPTVAAQPANGQARWQQFAAPAAGPERGPMIALVIDDLGLNRPKTWRTIELPAPLTLAFLTYAPGLQEMTSAARLRGHELIVHIPMQPIDPRDNPGRNPLVTEETRERLAERLIWGLGRFDGYVGINNHMGSRFTAWPEGMAVVMKEMRRRGLLFLDSLTTYDSVGGQVAERYGVPYAERDIFLDNQAEDAGAIRRQLDKLEATALERGYAVGIGHPYPNTLDVLSAWLPRVWARGLRLVPISAVVRHRIELAATSDDGG